MHARWGVIQVQPGRVDEFVRIFQDSMVPPARAQKGFKGLFLLTKRDTGKVVGASLWETEADARAVEMSSGSFGAQADKVKDIVTQMPVMEYYEVNEMGPAPKMGEGTHAGVTTVQVQPGKMDELASVVRDSVVPAVAQRGFKGGLILSDRDTGKAMLIGWWETEAHAAGLATSGSYQEQMAKVASVISGTDSRELYEVSLQV